jgi:pyridoxal 5'-phosphate synthase pdxT subunit
MRIGILALQGAFIEHIRALQALGVEACEVRRSAHLAGLAGLVIPGGESTTIIKLATQCELIGPLRTMGNAGTPMWGTCAGMILLAGDTGDNPPGIGTMDVRVKRNAFGRQVDSFEADLDIPLLAPPAPFHGIFIRAPLIERVGSGVEVLARLRDGTIVAARQGNLLATSFHPELTGDLRFHRLFVGICAAWSSGAEGNDPVVRVSKGDSDHEPGLDRGWT